MPEVEEWVNRPGARRGHSSDLEGMWSPRGFRGYNDGSAFDGPHVSGPGVADRSEHAKPRVERNIYIVYRIPYTVYLVPS